MQDLPVPGRFATSATVAATWIVLTEQPGREERIVRLARELFRYGLDDGGHPPVSSERDAEAWSVLVRLETIVAIADALGMSHAELVALLEQGDATPHGFAEQLRLALQAYLARAAAERLAPEPPSPARVDPAVAYAADPAGLLRALRDGHLRSPSCTSVVLPEFAARLQLDRSLQLMVRLDRRASDGDQELSLASDEELRALHALFAALRATQLLGLPVGLRANVRRTLGVALATILGHVLDPKRYRPVHPVTPLFDALGPLGYGDPELDLGVAHTDGEVWFALLLRLVDVKARTASGRRLPLF